jgi:hypothetical protein
MKPRDVEVDSAKEPRQESSDATRIPCTERRLRTIGLEYEYFLLDKGAGMLPRLLCGLFVSLEPELLTGALVQSSATPTSTAQQPVLKQED